MDAMAELDCYDFEPAVKAQVAELLQALTAELVAKDIKIAALTHELAYYKRIRFSQNGSLGRSSA